MGGELNFHPVNKAHAIAEMLVFFQFAPDLSPVLPALAGLQSDLQSKFPNAIPLQQLRVEVANGATTFQNSVSGLQLGRNKPDGSSEWMINIGLNAISVHCFDYTRWHLVWPEMRGYYGRIFHALGAAPIRIAAIGLKYIDRFLWNGPNDAYDAKELFDPKGTHLTAQSLRSGYRWHCHTGWFENDFGAGEILHQLNVDSGGHLFPTEAKTIVNIDHTMTLRASDEKLAIYGAIDPAGSAPLDKLILHFHSRNKAVLLDLLNPGIANRINLRAQP